MDGKICPQSSWRRDSKPRREKRYWERSGERSRKYLIGTFQFIYHKQRMNERRELAVYAILLVQQFNEQLLINLFFFLLKSRVLFTKSQTKNVLISRFLLIVFTASSLIATICCILMSPHFPDTTGDLMDVDEDDVFD